MYMEGLEAPTSQCDKINEASMAYADALNDDLSTYMTRLVSSFGLKKGSYVMAPYTYFYYSGFDVDLKNEMTPHSYDEDQPIMLYNGDEVDEARAASNYADVLDNYAPKWKKAKIVMGLVGITMVTKGEDDPDDVAAHYVSYVLIRGQGQKPTRLYMFDSGGWHKAEIYYHMIKDGLGIEEKDVVLNKGVFEKDGGEGKTEYTYVGQNIFCHTWSLWFWNQILGNGLTMSELNALAGKGHLKNQKNLIRIKTYVYTHLVPTVKLKFLSQSAERLFLRNFKYIFLNKETIRRQVIFPDE